MVSMEQGASALGIRGARRRAVDIGSTELVATGALASVGYPFPLLATPAVANVDLAEWGRSNRNLIESWLLTHGAILFRGFALATPQDFERAASAICRDLFGEYGDLPKEQGTDRLYGSTPYPADQTILFHNESSHLPSWPMKQFFFCALPSESGGETPILDCRGLCAVLDPGILKEFEERGLVYIRNFSPGVDVSWQDFFHTEDRAAVEEACRASGMGVRWKSSDCLEITQAAPAVRVHPTTGDRVFFNQVQLHHPRCLDPATRDSMLALFGENDLPRNVRYGDGAPIDDATIDYVGEVYDREAVAFLWERGDVLMLDNMLVAHGRKPFGGARKIVVGMAEMTGEGRR